VTDNRHANRCDINTEMFVSCGQSFKTTNADNSKWGLRTRATC